MIEALDHITRDAQLFVSRFTDLFSYSIKKVNATFDKNKIIIDKRINGSYICNNIPYITNDKVENRNESLRLDFDSGIAETKSFYGTKVFQLNITLQKTRISSYLNDEIAFQKIEEENKSDPTANKICLFWSNTNRNQGFKKEEGNPYRDSISMSQEVSLVQEIGVYAKVSLDDMKGDSAKGIEQISYSHIDKLLIQSFSSIIFDRAYNSSFLLFQSILTKEVRGKFYVVGLEFDYEERLNTSPLVSTSLGCFEVPSGPVFIKDLDPDKKIEDDQGAKNNPKKNIKDKAKQKKKPQQDKEVAPEIDRAVPDQGPPEEEIQVRDVAPDIPIVDPPEEVKRPEENEEDEIVEEMVNDEPNKKRKRNKNKKNLDKDSKK